MGPTGSGKSALALAIAARRPAVIINADAMQMVNALRVLAARPSVEEEAQAEHALYGILHPTEPTSVARWLKLMVPVVRRAWDEGKLPLIVGGTGMYLKALKDGLAEIPPVPDAIRTSLRALSAEEVRAQLEAKDPEMAARLKPGDSQRNLRALEVLEATGKSLAYWQQQSQPAPLPEAEMHEFYIDMPKPVLYPRLDARFMAMMEQGALEEVKYLLSFDPVLDTPISKAHGAPELADYLNGKVTLEEAIAKAQQNTRNYAKRQQTWIRNQMAHGTPLSGGLEAMILAVGAKLN
jgi:tRNA dimethylallyltransferase